MPNRVSDARRRGVHAPGDRGGARSDGGNLQGAARARTRKAPRLARTARRGMETMSDDMNDDVKDIKELLPDLNEPVETYPDDPAFDAWIATAAPRLNAPNATPRAEMWREIQGALRAGEDAQAGLIP